MGRPRNNPDDLRVCKSCGEEKKLSEFQSSVKHRKYMTTCYACFLVQRREMYATDVVKRTYHLHHALMSRTRKLDVPCCTLEEYRAVYHSSDECFYCDLPLTPENKHIDHRVPMSKGGNSLARNLTVTCSACNSAKQSNSEGEFIEWVLHVKQAREVVFLEEMFHEQGQSPETLPWDSPLDLRLSLS